MKVRFGEMPDALEGALFDRDGFALSGDEFLFTTISDVRFHYKLGQGVTAATPGAAAEDDFRLFLWGTVFGAVAWLNGYFPLHASAVAAGERAIAFTADSGVGKSTLAAALADRGFPHVCDDTLPLWLADAGPIAIPDRKPLKLWEDAFKLVPARRGEPIRSMPGKAYAAAASHHAAALPLTDLIVISQGDEVVLSEVRGAAKLDALVAAMYRDFIPAALGRRGAYRRDLVGIANSINIWRLTRPRTPDVAGFGRVTAEIAGLISTLPRRS